MDEKKFAPFVVRIIDIIWAISFAWWGGRGFNSFHLPAPPKGIMNITPDPLAMFEAGVSNIKSMADGSPRFEFEAGEDAIQFMTPLGQAKADKRYLMVIVYDIRTWEKIGGRKPPKAG